MRSSLFLIVSLFVSSIFAEESQLKESDIRETFEEIIGFHVEHNQVSEALFKRAYKIYIEQFDSGKMYLLNKEVKDYFAPSQKNLTKAVNLYKKEDYSNFRSLNEQIRGSIQRVQQIRGEIQKKLILNASDIEAGPGETYLSYCSTESQLRSRLSKQMKRILNQEKKVSGLNDWGPADRAKIFEIWEKRFQRREGTYLEQSRQEHYLSLHILRALAKSLDAHTGYFSPEEAKEMRTSLEKQFEGVGVVLREGVDGIIIADLIKGGPAERGGQIQIGDNVVEIEGKVVSSMDYSEVLKAMKGGEDNKLRLTLKKRGEEKQRTLTLQREKIMLNDERLKFSSYPVANGHIGVIDLPSFYEGGHSSNAESDLRSAIKKLKKQAPLKGIVLDMRENAGGFLSQAVKVAGLFVTQGVIVISKYSQGEIKYLRNLDGRIFFDGPLVVLTSKASASAAEIVAQALQDYGSALIVGDERTYGKGTIQYQTITDPRATSFYKVTVGRYYTVSGKSTQITGVKADIVVPTIFSSYKIGERFLDNPLPSDQVAAAYVDPLTDVDAHSRSWFKKNYLPNLHRPQERWKRSLPLLQENSSYRLNNGKNFQLFLKSQEKKERSPRSFHREKSPAWGSEDLQMTEAINIVKDMIILNNS